MASCPHYPIILSAVVCSTSCGAEQIDRHMTSKYHRSYLKKPNFILSVSRVNTPHSICFYQIFIKVIHEHSMLLHNIIKLHFRYCFVTSSSENDMVC